MNSLFSMLTNSIVLRLWASPHDSIYDLISLCDVRTERRAQRIKVLDPGFPLDDPPPRPSDPTQFPTDVPAPEPHDVPAPEPIDVPPPDPGRQPKPSERPPQDPLPRSIP